MEQRSQTCDRCSCNPCTTQTRTICRSTIRRASSSVQVSSATRLDSRSNKRISLPERTATRVLAVRPRLPLLSYKTPPPAANDHDGCEQEQSCNQQNEFR